MTDLLAHDVSGDGRVLLFVHGLTFSRRTWDPIVERLRDRFRCVTVDLPGHGDSDGSGADIQGVVKRLHATADQVTDQPPVVVAHSMGAMVATLYAADHETAGVVNVDQPLNVVGFATFLQQLAPALRGADFDRAFAPFRDSIGVSALPEPERSRVESTQRISRDLVLDYWQLPMTMPPQELQQLTVDALRRITAPYLWLSGADVVADEDRTVLLDNAPHARVEHWPGTGHVLHLADPDRFAALVTAFVDES